jgi:predicted DsbA family dithiol-disulfide isomerase
MKLLALSIVTLLSTTLFATAQIDKKVIAFEKDRFSQNQGITLKKVEIEKKETLPVKGWYGYVVYIQADIPNRGIVSAKDMFFSNGEVFTMDLINMKTKRSFKELLLPKVTKEYYLQDHLIAGDKNAKNKVVVFSDPLCPACQQSLPSIIDKVKRNSKDIALYYYHFPLLNSHPAADALSKAMLVAKQKGIKNIEEKVYTTDFSQYFDVTQTDAKIILDAFNKIFKTKITLSELNKEKVKHEITNDMKMGEAVMVQGTPTIFVNGINDRSRSLFYSLGK